MLFSTSRFLVRRFVPQDEPALHAILSDPAVMRHLEPPFAPAQTHAFLQTAGLCPDGSQRLIYAAESRTDHTVAGYLILHPYPGTADWELGWVLARRHWGKGCASELTAGAIAYARQQGIPGLILECAPAQAATVQLAANFGFVPLPPADGLLRFRLAL